MAGRNWAGAHRNWTGRYMKLRSSFRKDVAISMSDGSQNDPLVNDPAPTTHTPNIHIQLPPVWVDLLEDIDDSIENINTQIALLKSYHEKRLAIVFENPEKLDHTINETTKSITSMFRESQSKLKKIALRGNEEGESLPYQERVVRLNVMKSRATQVQELTTTFRRAQRDYLKELKRKEDSSKKYYDDDSIASTIPNLDRIEQGFNAEQIQQLEQVEQNASQRTKEIIAIAKSVNELAQLFNELSVLVVEQGSLLDRIDYNVEQTVESLKDSQQHLIKAEGHQKATRGALCIVLLIILICICAFVLIIRYASKSK